MLAVLDACAALQYKEDYSRALEKRAVARKALGEFALAVEDCKCFPSLSTIRESETDSSSVASSHKCRRVLHRTELSTENASRGRESRTSGGGKAKADRDN